EDLPVEVGLQSARRLRAPLAVDGGTDLALQRLRRHGADDAVLARPDPALEGLLVADVEGAVHRAAAPLLDRGIGLRTTDAVDRELAAGGGRRRTRVVPRRAVPTVGVDGQTVRD